MLTAEIRAALQDVIDPELDINVVDLGLIYQIREDADAVVVEMTMTSPACPMGVMLQEQAHQAIMARLPTLQHLRVELVWTPPWHAGLMSDKARQQLGWAD